MVLLRFSIPRTAQSPDQQQRLAENSTIQNPGTMRMLGLRLASKNITVESERLVMEVTLEEVGQTFRRLFPTPTSRAREMAKFGLGAVSVSMIQGGIQESAQITPP